VPDPCTVLIAAADLLPALKQRSWVIDSDVVTFAEEEALRALEEIIRRRPQTVALERQFAATPRGAALINRLKADPALSHSELRVVSHDSDFTRVVPRGAVAPVPIQAPPDTSAVAIAASAPLDQRGTRRAPRYKIAGDMSVLLDGNAAKLVDLSSVGAQVVSPTILKPNQRIRMALTDDHGALRFNAAIAWAAFEIPPQRSPRYRAGINFVDADSNAVGAFCMRHKQ
jgi:PilZ domain-containing protein